jgi:hypothetical protein
MRKDLTIYGLVILIGFLMGMFTCKTFTGKPAPVKVDTVVIRKVDSFKVDRPVPVRVTVPELATEKGRIETQVLRIPYPVYIPVAADDSCRHLYDQLYEDYATRREYDNTYPFHGDTVRVKTALQGNDIWDQQVYLSHAEKVLVQPQKKRNSVWWGASGYWIDSTAGLSTSLMFIHKKGWAIEAETGIDIRGNRKHEAGVKFNLGKK